jgi:Tfp pilus assembly protein PilO
MKSTRTWGILTGVVVVLVAIAGWFLLISPERSNAAAAQGQLSGLESQVAASTVQLGQLRLEAKTLPAKEEALRKFTKLMPPGFEPSNLLRELSSIATKTGVQLSAVRPASPSIDSAPVGTVPTGNAAAIPTNPTYLIDTISLSVTGKYFNVVAFLDDLETQPRALVVTEVQAGQATQETSSNNLDVSLTVRSYFAPNGVPMSVTHTTTGATGASGTAG